MISACGRTRAWPQRPTMRTVSTPPVCETSIQDGSSWVGVLKVRSQRPRNGRASTFEAAAAAGAETILFIGNSFTVGALSPVQNYRPETVTDLNKEGTGGVPALFKAFTTEAGLHYEVSLEAVGGANLDLHYSQKAPLFTRPWD